MKQWIVANRAGNSLVPVKYQDQEQAILCSGHYPGSWVIEYAWNPQRKCWAYSKDIGYNDADGKWWWTEPT